MKKQPWYAVEVHWRGPPPPWGAISLKLLTLLQFFYVRFQGENTRATSFPVSIWVSKFKRVQSILDLTQEGWWIRRNESKGPAGFQSKCQLGEKWVWTSSSAQIAYSIILIYGLWCNQHAWACGKKVNSWLGPINNRWKDAICRRSSNLKSHVKAIGLGSRCWVEKHCCENIHLQLLCRKFIQQEKAF